MVTLPDGVDACDIGTITVWCQPFKAIFTRLAVPRNVFVSGKERERDFVSSPTDLNFSFTGQ